MNKKLYRIISLVFCAIVIVGSGIIFSGKDVAADTGEFYLQVSPSPLVVTLKPGQTTTYDLKIRNAGSQTEKLKIAPRSFTIDDNTGQIKFDDTKPPAEIGDWIHFGSPNFTIDPGQWYTQKVTLAIPKEAGFSYSFGLVITRQDAPAATNNTRALKGSVAIFTLVNIDKPGATRTLQIDSFKADKSVYEYLPATLNLRLKNTGNTIVRPTGNIFVQRKSGDVTPISTLPLNPNEGYILPNQTRMLPIQWDDGFPMVRTTTDENGMVKKSVDWNWSNLSHIRIGRYTAKVIAIYNDGQRDIPVTGEVSFWVIPWKLLLIPLVVLILIGIGVWSITTKLISGLRSRKPKQKSIKLRR